MEEWGKLASYTQLVIFSPTFTLGRELLFHSASFSVFDSKTYLELCSKIKDGRERLKEVEKAVTCCLQKSLEQQEGSWAASEIEKLIADKDEASDRVLLFYQLFIISFRSFKLITHSKTSSKACLVFTMLSNH